MDNTRRIYGLDILRACAILFVMQMHSLEYIRPHAEERWLHYYWLFILDGVDLFFVLSGFLIGGILLRTINEKGISRAQLQRFWTRRWFRTLPNYFLVLIVLVIGYRIHFGELPARTPQFFVFTQCFADPHPHFFPEAWSLAVEEWFYLLVPIGLFVFLAIGGNKRKIILGWICFVLAAATVFRVYKSCTHQFDASYTWDDNIRKQVLTRLDSIMYGFLGAYISHYNYASWVKRRNLLFIAGILLLFGSRWLGSISPEYHQYLYISAQSLGTLLLLPKLSTVTGGQGAIYKAITFISVISYSLYLLNYTIVLKIMVPAIMRATNMDYSKNVLHALAGYFLFWCINIIAAYLLYRFYERPAMNLRERFKPRQS